MRLLITILLLLPVALYGQVLPYAQSGIPKVYIKPVNPAIGPQDPVKDVKIKCTMKIVNASGTYSTSYLPDSLYDGFVLLERAGNSTGDQLKKPYNIDLILPDSADNDKALFGWPSGKDFRLFSEPFDGSHIRNMMGFYAANAMGNWGARCVKVLIYWGDEVTNEPIGLYTFSESIKRGATRVPIPKLSITDTTAAKVKAGGYILETGPALPADTVILFPVSTPRGVLVKYPKPEDMNVQQAVYLRKFINHLDSLIMLGDLTDTVNGYRKYMDVPSMVGYLLTHELGSVYDFNSRYHYVTNDKIYGGPAWDYDAAYGNRKDAQPEFLPSVLDFWWPKLLTDPYFAAAYKNHWKSHRVSLGYIDGYVDSLTSLIYNSGAWEEDSTVWVGRRVDYAEQKFRYDTTSYAEWSDYAKYFMQIKRYRMDTTYGYNPVRDAKIIRFRSDGKPFAYRSTSPAIYWTGELTPPDPPPFVPLTLMHYWNFNVVTDSFAQLTATSGTGTITYTRGPNTFIQMTSNTGQTFAGLNARNGDAALTHVRINNPIGTTLVFNVPTTGRTGIIAKYEVFRSGSGAENQKVEYSTDGSTYTLLRNISISSVLAAVETLDFTAISAANNNANFKIRITIERGTSSVCANPASCGNNRIDNFTVEGN